MHRTELILATAKRTFVAFCFGLILSLVFSVAAALQFEPLVKLERESSDLGLRVANAVFSQSYEETPLPDGTSPLYLVDVDAEACAILASANRCNFDRIMQPEVLDALATTIAIVEPSIVVFDGLIIPEIGADFLERVNTLGIPVISPMELSEFDSEEGSQTSQFGYRLDKSLCSAPDCGKLSYRPAQIFKEGGRTRYYPSEMRVLLLDGLDDTALREVTLETLAYTAAKQSSPKGELFDRGPEPEISYTIPSFAFQGGGQRIDEDRYGMIKAGFRGNVDHLSLSSALMSGGDDGAEIELDFAKPEAGSVLVIGSTALSGQDIHNTPLGPMGGMEVVANAVRSFQLATPEAIVSPIESFLIKMSAVLKALVIIALTEVFLAFLAQKRSYATKCGEQTVECGSLFDRWSFWIVLAMLFAFSAELCVAAWEILSQMQSSAGTSQAVDVIWPIAGVTASALIGFSSEIQSKLEWIADRLMATLSRRLERQVAASDASSPD